MRFPGAGGEGMLLDHLLVDVDIVTACDSVAQNHVGGPGDAMREIVLDHVDGFGCALLRAIFAMDFSLEVALT